MVPGVMLYIQYWWPDGTGTIVRWNRQPLFFIPQDHLGTFHVLRSRLPIIQPVSHLIMPRWSCTKDAFSFR